MPELRRTLELAGCIVTLDAMGCQRRIAREIIEADDDDVLARKGSQGTAHAEIQSYLDAAIAALRRWALNLLKTDTRKTKRSIKAKIKAAGWDHQYLLHLLSLPQNLDA